MGTLVRLPFSLGFHFWIMKLRLIFNRYLPPPPPMHLKSSLETLIPVKDQAKLHDPKMEPLMEVSPLSPFTCFKLVHYKNFLFLFRYAKNVRCASAEDDHSGGGNVVKNMQILSKFHYDDDVA